MLVPGVALGRGVMDHAQLAYRVDGMGIEIGGGKRYGKRQGKL
jgi:hypothetical protein